MTNKIVSEMTLAELCSYAREVKRQMRDDARQLANSTVHSNIALTLFNGAAIMDEFLIQLKDKLTLQQFQDVTHANLQAKVNQSIDEVTENGKTS